MSEAVDQARAHRICGYCEHDRGCRHRLLRCKDRDGPGGYDDIDPRLSEFGSNLFGRFATAVTKANFDLRGVAIDPAHLLQTL
jgi:hypothetical protein